MKVKQGYNERLFSGHGVRNYFHTARYRWVCSVLEQIDCVPRSIIEIGCFDGKLLDYFKKKPDLYIGIDAGWEGGIDHAIKKYSENRNYQFIKTTDPHVLNALGSQSFDIAIAMETFEHIPPAIVDEYLSNLSRLVPGYILITVPNEKGIVFLMKWLIKKIFYGGAEKYTIAELCAATFGHMDQVSRNEHKGFDYLDLIENIRKYYDISKIDSIPFFTFPPSLSLNIGILARSRNFLMK